MKWGGLARYRNANVPVVRRRVVEEEYGRVRDVLVGDEMGVLYFADVPGVVGGGEGQGEGEAPKTSIQTFFFPPTYTPQTPTPPPTPTSLRTHTTFTMTLTFHGPTKLRLPTREPSKDWMYLNDPLADEDPGAGAEGKTGRKFGWVDFEVAGGVEVRGVVPQVVGEEGYVSSWEVLVGGDGGGVRGKSSLGGGEWVGFEGMKLKAHLPTPLHYHAPRTWTFDIQLTSLRLNLLRDHITLLTDLANDWTSGPPVGKEMFVPVEYKFCVGVEGWEWRVCGNLGNVGGGGKEGDEDSYLTMRGKTLTAALSLPFLKFEPLATEVTFTLTTTHPTAHLDLPPHSTYGTFQTPDARFVGRAASIDIDGHYRWFREVRDGDLDSFKGDVRMKDLVMHLSGVLAPFFVSVKENYFGNTTSHISRATWVERKANWAKVEEEGRRRRAGVGAESGVEVFVGVGVVGVRCVLGEGVYDVGYGCRRGKEVGVWEAERIEGWSKGGEEGQELRFDISPVTWYRTVLTGPLSTTTIHNPNNPHNTLYINGITLTGHRLFGPPPLASCFAVDYRVDVGRLSGCVTPGFVERIGAFGAAFGAGFEDRDNAPLLPVVMDLTCVAGRIVGVDVGVLCDGDGGEGSIVRVLCDEGVVGRWDNVVYEGCVGRGSVEVGEVEVKGLWRVRGEEFVEVFGGRCGVRVGVFAGEGGWEEKGREQAAFVGAEDVFGRCDGVFGRGEVRGEGVRWWRKFRPPFLLPGEGGEGWFEGGFEGQGYDFGEGWEVESDGDGEDEEELEEEEEEDISLRGFGRVGVLPYAAFLRKVRMVKSRGGQRVRFVGVGVDDEGRRRGRKGKTRRDDGGRDGVQLPGLSELSEDDRAIISFSVTTPLEILLTPASGNVLSAFLKALDHQHIDAESILDSLQLENLQRITREFRFRFNSTALHATIPTIKVHAIQDMLLPDESTFVSGGDVGDGIGAGVKRRGGVGEALVCVGDLVVEGVEISGMVKMENPK
ncbi:hypothetical protein HDV00_010847, partial [Rhizophlyctis rosea]